MYTQEEIDAIMIEIFMDPLIFSESGELLGRYSEIMQHGLAGVDRLVFGDGTGLCNLC